MSPAPQLSRVRSQLGFHAVCQTLGRKERVAAKQEFSDFLPVNVAHVQPQRYPSSRAYVGGKIKSVGLSLDQRVVVARQNLSGDCDDAIAMMIIEEV